MERGYDDMKDFFLYQTEGSANAGFEMYETCHLLWLIGIGIFSWWMGRFFSFAAKSKREFIRKVFGYLFPSMAILREIVLIVTGHLVPDMYPFHLCNMSLWVATIYIWCKNRFAGVVYVLLCMPAATLALCFPGWTRYPFWTFMHIYDFIFHGCVVAFGWMLVRGKEMIPDWKELWKPLIFGITGCVVMYYVNCGLDTDFWFVNKPSDGSPLSWIYSELGDGGYKIGHFLFCSMVVVVWQAVIYFCFKKRKRLK